MCMQINKANNVINMARECIYNKAKVKTFDDAMSPCENKIVCILTLFWYSDFYDFLMEESHQQYHLTNFLTRLL